MIRWGIRFLQLIFIALGAVLHSQIPEDVLQVTGIWSVVVLFVLIAEITRRWVAASELYVLRISSATELQKTNGNLRYSLLSLFILQATWWLLYPLNVQDQLAWSVLFTFPVPVQWQGLQVVAGMVLLLLWISMERWTYALQSCIQGQQNPRLMRFCTGMINLLIPVLQVAFLLHLGLLPFGALPTDGTGYALLGVQSIYTVFLICFFSWIRSYLQQVSTVSALRLDRAVSGSS
ncbi:hypothetical protein [Deinococcus cellulosilyticus]|uniref:Uncharacterized protein n=1 Tax=Deinococcus cellulosilyticus (strain DSM 18568 / NBRC 106333 / KACC 11606 / 5516J-15) TaxID=1223518 RepID=A0A511NAV7_DEIC1|nr:hypothetical protein [Deinococcus cellulosilyticus]GEM49922.1 hypothetical protein DC3_55570 [Deinococcus cellulosilyticus NBRC 106333 = KACC 11606]